MDESGIKARDDLRNLLKPLVKPAARIIVKESGEEGADSALKSHFGGSPYFEKGEAWPVTASGNKLAFVFQIFNSGGIALPDNVKLVQFYYDFEEGPWAWDTEDEGWLVKVYEKLDTDNAVIIEKPGEHYGVHYCEVEFEATRSLPDWEGIGGYCEDAEKLSCALADDGPWEPYDEAAEELAGEQDLRSQIGGYPAWVQGDETPDDSDYTLLFQLDSEYNAGLMWGDCGMVYVFYNSRTKDTRFVLQCC